ncbi:MAG: DUF202 domain-containing protein [archaeon]
MAEERTILAKERTLYSEERTFLAIVRTVVGIVGLAVLVLRFVVKTEFYSDLLIVVAVLFGIIVLSSSLHKFHKKKNSLKTLEERIDN